MEFENQTAKQFLTEENRVKSGTGVYIVQDASGEQKHYIKDQTYDQALAVVAAVTDAVAFEWVPWSVVPSGDPSCSTGG